MPGPSGVVMSVLYGIFSRLAGADAVVFPSYGGRFTFTAEDCRKIAESARKHLGELAAIFPSPGGGITEETIPKLAQLYGRDVIYLVGGGIFRHDVLVQQSQIGIIYVSKATEKFMHRLFQHKGLEFIPFRQYPPYVYLRAQHPLASRKQINVRELEPYPYVRYGQGQDPYLFSEEVIIPDMSNKKLIYVTDRSSLLSMLRNTNSFNIGTGCLLPDIVGDAIISIPVEDCIDMMEIGWLKLKNMKMTQEMTLYVQLLEDSLNRCT